jgi:serine/threonine protein phosphatase PrpC
MRFTLAQDSRIGARRVQQDRAGYWRTQETLLMVVADGLGGHPRGEIAAELAVEHFAAAFGREGQPRLSDPAAFLAHGIEGAHADILQAAQRLGLHDMPRTVVVACVVQEGHAYWTHVGDCRLYILREGRVLVRTRDHTLVQRLVDAGRIREEAIASHPERNRLLQCLGGFQTPRPEPTARHRLAKDDVVLLCSDGFWGPLTQRQMVGGLLLKDPAQVLPELTSLAETRAGPQCDNVTALAMAWGEEELAADDSAPTVPHYDLPTDVQDFTATDPDFLRLSEQDIEKAIAEIKAALRKNAST